MPRGRGALAHERDADGEADARRRAQRAHRDGGGPSTPLTKRNSDDALTSVYVDLGYSATAVDHHARPPAGVRQDAARRGPHARRGAGQGVGLLDGPGPGRAASSRAWASGSARARAPAPEFAHAEGRRGPPKPPRAPGVENASPLVRAGATVGVGRRGAGAAGGAPAAAAGEHERAAGGRVGRLGHARDAPQPERGGLDVPALLPGGVPGSRGEPDRLRRGARPATWTCASTSPARCACRRRSRTR